MTAPLPENEVGRLAALYKLGILDTPAEREFDDITLLASQICGTPIAIISLLDESRQWFKSRVGLDVPETPRDQAFCSYTILNAKKTMVVTDAATDDRFRQNPLVTGEPKIRFYAGAPLLTQEDLPLGSLCVIDREPRELNFEQLAALEALARQVSLRLELRRTTMLLQEANTNLKQLSLLDDLTGLYNRRGFFLHAEQQIKLYRSRKSERSIWVMVGDMDGLKQINDQFGHMEGSAAINRAAVTITKTFRDADIIARLGGDEFVALMLNTLDEVAERVPSRLQANFDDFNAQSGLPYKLAMSIGMVKIDFSADKNLVDLINQADELMYENKRNKKKQA
ncbi:MAG: diguanylate cyclase domain-containing protein [Pyrinomonadaceae bacterium]